MAKNRAPKSYDEYPALVPDMSEWAIVKLTENKEEFFAYVSSETKKKILQEVKEVGLFRTIEQTIRYEKIRIKNYKWAVDPKDEGPFWNAIQTELESLTEDSQDELEKILDRIISRYLNEIAGKFSPKSYKFAKFIAKTGFARFLNASPRRKGKKRISGKYKESVYERIKVKGKIDDVRALSKKGTILLLPTHFSNLDSIVIGWCIQAIGLPAFLYGAGINLFNIKLLAYFMTRLGAYKVDRRKKNRIYLETLKAYSLGALNYKAHSLFFPGGTRSRSGAIEDKLKLGLLGSAIEAQRLNCIAKPENPDKIFVVPAVINYHFVLEAPSLINQHLKKAGKDKIESDEDALSTSYKMFKFILKFLTASSEFSVSFGTPMDVFGNEVDKDGKSLGHGKDVDDLTGYFKVNDELCEDSQRDFEYTKLLADRVSKEYLCANNVLTSHALAFAAFRMIIEKYPNLDLYQVLNLPEEDIKLTYAEFEHAMSLFIQKLKEMKAKNMLTLDDPFDFEIEDFIKDGLHNLGLYHAHRPLIRDKSGDIRTKSLKTLYYYHNRMAGYQLEDFFKPSNLRNRP